MFFSCMVPFYAMAFFLPVLLRAMGFGLRDSLLLSTPPYLASVSIPQLLSDLQTLTGRFPKKIVSGRFRLLLRLASRQDQETCALDLRADSDHDHWNHDHCLLSAQWRAVLRLVSCANGCCWMSPGGLGLCESLNYHPSSARTYFWPDAERQ